MADQPLPDEPGIRVCIDSVLPESQSRIRICLHLSHGAHPPNPWARFGGAFPADPADSASGNPRLRLSRDAWSEWLPQLKHPRHGKRACVARLRLFPSGAVSDDQPLEIPVFLELLQPGEPCLALPLPRNPAVSQPPRHPRLAVPESMQPIIRATICHIAKSTLTNLSHSDPLQDGDTEVDHSVGGFTAWLMEPRVLELTPEQWASVEDPLYAMSARRVPIPTDGLLVARELRLVPRSVRQLVVLAGAESEPMDAAELSAEPSGLASPMIQAGPAFLEVVRRLLEDAVVFHGAVLAVDWLGRTAYLRVEDALRPPLGDSPTAPTFHRISASFTKISWDRLGLHGQQQRCQLEQRRMSDNSPFPAPEEWLARVRKHIRGQDQMVGS